MHECTKRNSNQKLGDRTIDGVLALAKFIDSTKPDRDVKDLKQTYSRYLEQRNHPVAKYALFLYLKSLGYQEKTIKEVVDFKNKTKTAISDSEKLESMVLTKQELTYLVQKIPKKRDKLIVKLLYDTGARVSELTNLKRKDINMEASEARLLGKGRKPRTVYFQDSTKLLLQEFLFENAIENPNQIVIGIKPITVWYHLKKYGKEILDRDLRPHMLRHSRLQHMADEGVDSFLIKSYAGHSDIGTTQIYVKNSKYQRKLAFYKAGDIWEED